MELFVLSFYSNLRDGRRRSRVHRQLPVELEELLQHRLCGVVFVAANHDER